MADEIKPIVEQYTPQITQGAPFSPKNDVQYMVDGIRESTRKPNNLDFANYQNYEDSSVDSLFSPKSSKVSFQNKGFRIEDAYVKLNSGEYIPRFENFLQGTDNEERLAKEQTTSNKWSRGIAKFFGKTGTAVLGGTIGAIYGIGAGISEGKWDAIWDNEFYKEMDDWNKRMDNSLSNYYTKEEKDMGFFSSAGTANFWANDFLGGLSFTAGVIISEGLWAAATGGASLGVKAARMGLRGAANALDKVADVTRTAKMLKQGTAPMKNYLSKMEGIERATNLGKSAQGLNTVRYIYTSAGYEAGVEARAYTEEQREAFDYEFKNTFGRAPTTSEVAEFEKNLASSTNSVFATNLALVGSSNLAVFGKMFNLSNPIAMPKSAMRKFMFGQGVETVEGTSKAISKNVAQRIAGTTYSIFKVPFIEGVYEEGLQAVTSTSAGAFLQSTYDMNEDTLGLMEAVYEGLSHTYGTKEGFKEVGLGMLIGAFGGGVANIGSGQSPFKPVAEAAAKTSKRDINVAEELNKYSSKKLANEIFRANGINSSNKEADKAQQKGDLFHSEASRTMGMMANIMYAERMGFGEEVAEEFKMEADNFDVKVLAKNLDITEEEAKQVKESSLQEYNKLRSTFNKNKEFANYIIGRGKVKDGAINVDLAREMIAYQMTMGDKAESLSNDFAKAIMAEVGDFTSYGIRLKSFLEVQNTLRKGTKEDKLKFNSLQKEHKILQKRHENLEKQRLTQQSRLNSTKEDNSNMAGAHQNTVNEIATVQQDMTNLELQLEQSIAAMATYGIEKYITKDEEGNITETSVSIILGKDLANIESNLNDVDSYFEKLEAKNPEKAHRIKVLTNGYRASLQGARLYGEVIEDLLNPKTQLKGSTRTFLSKLKEYSEPTERLVENLKRQQLIFASQAAPIFKIEEAPVAKVEEVEADIAEDAAEDTIQDTTQDTAQDVTQETTPEKFTLKQFDEHIGDLLRSNNYVLQNFGEDIESRKPTEEEVNRYEELLGKISSNIDPDSFIGSSLSTIAKRGLNKIGLTKEELAEFVELNQRLSDWRLIDGVEVDGVSLVDVLKQKEAYKTEIAQRDVNNLEENEELEVARGVKNAGNRAMTSEMINTPENALVKKISSKYELSHVKLDYFLGRGAIIVQSGAPKTDLTNLKKGTYKIVFDEQEVVVKLSSHGRLVMDLENFEKLLSLANLAVFNTENVKGSTWNDVYEKQEDGSYVPLKSTFEIRDVGSEFNLLDPQSLYNLKQNEQLFFKLSLTDDFNIYLRDELRKAIAKYEESPSSDNETALNNIKTKIHEEAHIYIVTGNGDVVGQLKAKHSDTENVGSFLAIRKYAGNILLDRYDPDTPIIQTSDNLVTSELGAYNSGTGQTLYTLPFTTHVTNVFAGSPNLKISVDEETGVATAEKTSFNDRTITMVESFGIVENSVMEFNENASLNPKKVKSQFVSGITKPTPFVVIAYNNQKIAYPISLETETYRLMDEVSEIYSAEMTPSERAEKLIIALAEGGLDPKKYSIRHLDADNTFFGTDLETKMLADVAVQAESVSKEEFLSKGYKVSDIQQNAKITINLENVPFQNPKVEMNLRTETLYTREADQEEVSRFEITQVAEEQTLQSIVNQLLTKKEEELSAFHKKVLNLNRKEIEGRVAEKLKLSEQKKEQSTKEKNKKCQDGSKL